MRKSASFFALLGETFAVSSLFWIFDATVIMRDAPAIPGLIYNLIFTTICAVVFVSFLKKERELVQVAIVSGLLFVLEVAAYVVLRLGIVTFGYVLASMMLSILSVFYTLYLVFKEQTIVKHIIALDEFVMASVWYCFCYKVTDVSVVTTACVVVVILVILASGIGLRMNDGNKNEGVGKAFALAFVSAGVVALIVMLLIKLLSRSTGVTNSVINGIKAVLGKIWALMNKFYEWLASIMNPSEGADVSFQSESIQAPTEELEAFQLNLNWTLIGIVVGIVVLAAIVVIVIKFRNTKHKVYIQSAAFGDVVRVQSEKGIFSKKIKEFLKKLKFRKDAFVNRNTAPGLLVWLEKRAAAKKEPREEFESIRAFITRLAPGGELLPLAVDMEQCLYGSGVYKMTASDVKECKKAYKAKYSKTEDKKDKPTEEIKQEEREEDVKTS